MDFTIGLMIVAAVVAIPIVLFFVVGSLILMARDKLTGKSS